MYKRKDFITLLLSDSNKVSVKRLATFMAMIHFFTFSFISIFIKRDFFNKEILLDILDIDKFIIGIGLTVITAGNVAQYVAARFSKTNQDATDTTKPPVEPGPDDNKETK